MAKEKDDVPEHIKKYESLKKKAKRIGDTTELAHSKAYTTAAEALLKDKEGNIDYELLDKSDIQQKFTDKMTEHYITAANKYFGSKLKPEDQFQVDQLMQAYAGVTKTELGKYVKTFGKKYTMGAHNAQMGELLKKVKDQLGKSASSHLKDEHVGDFVKHLGLEDMVDSTKMRIEDIRLLHDEYEVHGTLSPKLIENAYQKHGEPKPIYLKKKKDDKEYKAAA